MKLPALALIFAEPAGFEPTLIGAYCVVLAILPVFADVAMAAVYECNFNTRGRNGIISDRLLNITADIDREANFSGGGGCKHLKGRHEVQPGKTHENGGSCSIGD